jgi:hypothetical protein
LVLPSTDRTLDAHRQTVDEPEPDLAFDSTAAATMNSAEILTAGKALIWFAIPLAIAFWELWRLRDRD